ncbi:short-subunit dehydrogenase [Paraburkholderia sp. HC6.4b]|nr:short-subunit dehydrogenase [Paraburkholderia sp. HC6.4b]MBB5455009.1 short-subunit dehydrogenase [Paraburkholderia sp. Kb1A]
MIKQGGGSIIFTSTFVGYSFAFPGTAAYAASKVGLIGLTQALAAEYGPQGVRVNAILPGAVDTQMYRGMNDTAESQTFVTGLHALKRVAKPEEIARSALYLASDDSSFVTGTASLVDGGGFDYTHLSFLDDGTRGNADVRRRPAHGCLTHASMMSARVRRYGIGCAADIGAFGRERRPASADGRTPYHEK